MTQHTTAEVLATVKTLKADARKVEKSRRLNSHYQIATRRIADAKLFADKNVDYAVQCCWDARYHLSFVRD